MMLCAHPSWVQHGVGTGTSPSTTLWGPWVCSCCGVTADPRYTGIATPTALPYPPPMSAGREQ